MSKLSLFGQKQRYVKAHRDKQAKKLFSNASTLGSNARDYLIADCLKNLGEDSAASVVLAALFLGRGFQQIFDTLVTSDVEHDSVLYPKFAVTPNFKQERWIVKSDEHDAHYNSELYLFLPSMLLKPLETAKEKLNVDDIGLFLSNLSFGSRHYTEAKICSYIDTQRAYFEISQTELSVIKNKSATECINLSYGQLDLKTIQDKLNKLIEASLQNNLPIGTLIEQYECKSTKFGSYYCPSEVQIDDLFTFLCRTIKDAQLNDYSGLKLLNYVTIYTAFYFATCTMCRPEFLSTVTLQDFCLSTRHIKINDKLDSARITAISQNCADIIKGYLSFLKQNVSLYSVQSSSLADAVQNAINGNSPLFSINDKAIVRKFSAKEAVDILADFEPTFSNLKENFTRHFSAAQLTNLGISRDATARTMGHSSESYYASRFSCLNINDLSSVAKTIDSSFLDRHFIDLREL
jgi:hypothetical protein